MIVFTKLVWVYIGWHNYYISWHNGYGWHLVGLVYLEEGHVTSQKELQCLLCCNLHENMWWPLILSLIKLATPNRTLQISVKKAFKLHDFSEARNTCADLQAIKQIKSPGKQHNSGRRSNCLVPLNIIFKNITRTFQNVVQKMLKWLRQDQEMSSVLASFDKMSPKPSSCHHEQYLCTTFLSWDDIHRHVENKRWPIRDDTNKNRIFFGWHRDDMAKNDDMLSWRHCDAYLVSEQPNHFLIKNIK